MNIGIIGYGKMGKEIERAAREKGFTVGGTFDIDTPLLTKEQARTIDVGIHFAAGDSVLRDVEHWSRLGKDLVIGTTGWGKDLDAVRAVIKKAGTGLLYASNFSVGVNVLFRLARNLASMVNALPEYDVSIQETHHKEKADSPSGTALSLAEILLKSLHRKKNILTGTSQGKIDPSALNISSTRVGNVVGTHTVLVDSAADSIELTHRAKNRQGFALGALLAAEWIRGRKGVFTMDDLFETILH